MLQRELPSLVILSNRLPDGNGVDMIEEIGRLDSELPVVVTFDEADAHLSAAALAKGAFDAFLKAGPTAIRIAGRTDAILGGLNTEDEKATAVRQLAEANAVLRAHLEATSEGVLVFDAEGRVVSFNHRFLELWDVPLSSAEAAEAGTLLSRIFADANDPETPAAAASRALADPELVLQEQVVEFANGKVVSWSTHPVRLDDGSTIGRAFDFRDLTAQIAAEGQARLQEILLEQIPTAVVATDLDGTVRYWNRVAEQLLGWSAGEAVGQNIRRLLFPDREEVERAMRRLKTGGGWHGEIAMRRRDGSSVPTLFTLTRSAAVQGPEMIVGVLVDMTERRGFEAKLFQAQKMEAVGTLAGGLAHDFNNLLTGVLGAAALARTDRQLDPKMGEVLATIERAALRGRDLCNQLLSFSRSERPTLTPVDPVETISEVVKIVERTFPKEVRINVELAEGLPALLGDGSRINHALLNLLVNARDAMPDGGSLTVRASVSRGVPGDQLHTPVSGDATYVCLEVEDSGVGIPAGVLPRVFEPFFTTKGSGKGTGLGLPMVFSVARAHGGEVRIWTEVGRGTRVQLYIPATDRPAESWEAEQVGEALERYAGRETVLIVDDEAIVRSVGAKILTEFGYTPIEATGGAEALRILREEGDQRIALVLLDLVMPEMGGPEVFARLRADYPDLPVLLCSGYSVKGIVEELLDQGAVGFVQKPYHLRDLLAKLRVALDQCGAKAARR